MLNLHRVLFCTGIDLHDIMQTDCLACKYFVFFIAFYWLITKFGIVWYVIIGVPPRKALQFTSIRNQNF